MSSVGDAELPVTVSGSDLKQLEADDQMVAPDPEADRSQMALDDLGYGHVTQVDMTPGDAPSIDFDEYDIIESGVIVELDDDLPDPPDNLIFEVEDAPGEKVLLEEIPQSLDAPGDNKVNIAELEASLDAPGDDKVNIADLEASLDAPGDDKVNIAELEASLDAPGPAKVMEEDVVIISEAEPIDQQNGITQAEMNQANREQEYFSGSEKVLDEDVVIEAEPVDKQNGITEVEINQINREPESFSVPDDSYNYEKPTSSGYRKDAADGHQYEVVNSDNYLPSKMDNADGMNGAPIAVQSVSTSQNILATRPSVAGYDYNNSGYAVANAPQAMPDHYEMQPMSGQTSVVTYSQPGPLPNNNIQIERNEDHFKLYSITNMNWFFAFACISFIINVPLGAFALWFVQKGRDAETPSKGRRWGAFAVLIGILGICVTVAIVLGACHPIFWGDSCKRPNPYIFY